jgi:hypothetical protein
MIGWVEGERVRFWTRLKEATMPGTANSAQFSHGRGRPAPRSWRGRGPTFWFIVAVVAVLLFGVLLAVVIGLATQTTHTSDRPNQNTNNTSLGQLPNRWTDRPGNGVESARSRRDGASNGYVPGAQAADTSGKAVLR